MGGNSEKETLERLMSVLEKVAPGTELREAFNRILQVGSGALIVAGDIQELKGMMSGGFRIVCDFTAPRLFELAKMDGAVLLSKNLKTINYANVHLVPDSTIITHEAGMRHRTAERVARQMGDKAFVVAISEKMKSVSVYLGNDHFTLESIPLALAKADQALQTLGRYRARLDEKYGVLDILEVEDMVTLKDVVKVLQRNEGVDRIAADIRFRVSELGVDGRLVSLQLNELMAGVENQEKLLVKDYYIRGSRRNSEKVIANLGGLSNSELMLDASVARVLGYKGSSELLNKLVRPRGFRILSTIPRMPVSVVEKVVARFDNLRNIMMASTALLDEVDGVGQRRAIAIKEGLDRISESA